jgi:hypothetical protein
MADKREIAEEILKEAYRVVMTQRQNAHGDAENSFDIIGRYWQTYLLSKGYTVQISAYDVAQMMVLLKVARASMGNGTHADHYVDTAGYSALAAMLAGATPPVQPKG